MASLYLLIPLSILLLLAGVGVYFWAVRNGQYDDLDGEAERLLFDDQVFDDEVFDNQVPEDEVLEKGEETRDTGGER